MKNRAFDQSKYPLWIDPHEVVPYAKNAKKHTEKQIKNIMSSIRRFGWQQDTVITKDKVLVIGHGRREAALRIGCPMPYHVVDKTSDELTDEEIRELRIADNKVNESAWDFELLETDIDGLEFDGLEFDFDFPAPEKPKEEPEDDDGYYGDERERTMNKLNLRAFDPSRTDGWYQMPTLQACSYIPETLTAFHEFVSGYETDTIHFFIDDYQFERIWESPQKYIDMMLARGIKAALTPDFSLYTDMPEALRIYNVYRSRLIGQMMQDAGVQVIPTLQWAQESTFKYCFDGLQTGGVVAVSTVGVIGGGDCDIWRAGMQEAIRVLSPDAVLVFGGEMPGFDFGSVKTKRYEAHKFTV